MRLDFAKSLIDDLRESQLWPLAIVLVVALVAIPVLLSKPAKEVGPAAPSATPTTLPEFQPIANVTAPTALARRKSVARLARRNPFTPIGQPKQSSASASFGNATPSGTTGQSGATGGSSGATAGGTSGTTGGSTGTGSTPTGSTTGSTPNVFYTYVADVRFGELGQTETKTLQRLRSLPSSTNPIVVFLGVTTDGETAVFLVSGSADPSGEGTCKPSDEECSFLYMKKDETETFDVADATGALKTYELTLRKIEAKKIDDPTKSSAKSSSSGDDATPATSTRASGKQSQRNGFRYFQAIDRIGF
jgi:hypothetical protein